MGRPLNKKYFGNRNIGSSSTTADDGIGGEGIASINWSDRGSWRTGPVAGLALPAPTIPGGVQATWTLLYSVATVSTGAGKINLAVGWKGTNASIPGLEVTVTDISGTNAVFAVTTPATPLAIIPFSGNGQGVTFTKSGGSGTAATFLTDVNWQVDASTALVEKGSGYTGTETFTVTVGSGTPPAGTIVLTTDQTDANGNQYASRSGDANRTNYQENAILIYAKTTSGGTSKLGDIVSQKGNSIFKIKTADGTANCLLKNSAVSAAGEATITATDSDNNTYYVTKITAHRCTVYSGTGTQFANYQSVPWTFSSATAGVSVKIPNA